MCRCGLKAPRWISWSDENPGRRYYQCRRGRSDMDCGFLMWIDPEPTPFMKTLLLDLRDAVWRLKKDNAELQLRLGDGLEVPRLKEIIQALEKENIENTEELSSRSICSSFSTIVCAFAVALGVVTCGVLFRWCHVVVLACMHDPIVSGL
ncbi:hypothetical protein PVAP13_5KG701000 [Panicum virgatum]|uniref:GRF-type domain-containing protein n=1 Tax=Panicum virgatum TaxID=38727 RepID=A0A8T0T2Z6_PANVG|nr:hypothetical protein PVAP13_5KG701000 [Panicum virgatum]